MQFLNVVWQVELSMPAKQSFTLGLFCDLADVHAVLSNAVVMVLAARIDLVTRFLPLAASVADATILTVIDTLKLKGFGVFWMLVGK